MKDRSTEALFAIRKALAAEDDDQVQEWLDRATELVGMRQAEHMFMREAKVLYG